MRPFVVAAWIVRLFPNIVVGGGGVGDAGAMLKIVSKQNKKKLRVGSASRTTVTRRACLGSDRLAVE